MIEYKDQEYWNKELLSASLINYLDGVKTAILHGANVNAQDDIGWTPLMRATCFDHHAIVEFLLQHPSIDVNVKDEYGRTALMIAVLWHHSHLVEFLLQHPGVDVNAKYKDGRTPLMLSFNNYIIGLLKDAGAK